jgi:hypothetical protein
MPWAETDASDREMAQTRRHLGHYGGAKPGAASICPCWSQHRLEGGLRLVVRVSAWVDIGRERTVFTVLLRSYGSLGWI